MTTAYTSLLGLALPVQGELSGTWGDTVNNYITQYVDAAIAGAQALSSDADVTLTKTTGGSLGATSSQYAILLCTGARTVLRTITAPAASKTYVVINATTGGYGVKLVGAGPTTGVTIDNGKSALCAWNGSDFVIVATNKATLPDVANTFTALQTFTGSTSVLAAAMSNIVEPVTISATAATGTINYDVTTQSVLYYTSNAAANWTVNFRASSGTTLNAAMSTGQAVTVAFLVTQGSTAYYNNVVQVDGTPVTPKWQGGAAPFAGNASSVDVYTYTIVKTGSGTFTVLASQTQFA